MFGNKLIQTETATDAYETQQNEVLRLLDELNGDLGRHNRDFDKTGRRHWGYPGDLTHVCELLQEARRSLGGIN